MRFLQYKEGEQIAPFAPDDIQTVWCGHGSLGGQDSSAFGTAAGKDLAAVGGSHSLAETMDLCAMALSGLIGTQHLGTPPVILCSTTEIGRSKPKMLHIFAQMVLYRKSAGKVNRKFYFFARNRKLVAFCRPPYKILCVLPGE